MRLAAIVIGRLPRSWPWSRDSAANDEGCEAEWSLKAL
jgi:hypothetical protein